MNKFLLILGIIVVIIGIVYNLFVSSTNGGVNVGALLMYLIGGVCILVSFWKKK